MLILFIFSYLLFWDLVTPVADKFLYYVCKWGSLVLVYIDVWINTGSYGCDVCAPHWFLGVVWVFFFVIIGPFIWCLRCIVFEGLCLLYWLCITFVDLLWDELFGNYYVLWNELDCRRKILEYASLTGLHKFLQAPKSQNMTSKIYSLVLMIYHVILGREIFSMYTGETLSNFL